MPSSPGFRHLAHAHRSERVIGGLSPAAECGGRALQSQNPLMKTIAFVKASSKHRPIGVTYD
jgi:hypothetical protein